MAKDESYEYLKETITSSEEVFNGRVIRVTHDEVLLPDGNRSKREIVHHNGAVAIVAVSGSNMIFVRQYRVPTGEVLLEIPAGKVEQDEAPEYTAAKELKEEVGGIARNMKKLYEFYTAPGFASELIHLYIAEDIKFESQSLENDEFLDIVEVPFSSLRKNLEEGNFRDAKTIIAVQYVLSHL